MELVVSQPVKRSQLVADIQMAHGIVEEALPNGGTSYFYNDIAFRMVLAQVFKYEIDDDREHAPAEPPYDQEGALR